MVAKFESLDHFDISLPRMVAVALAVSACAGVATDVAVGGTLGGSKPAVLILVGSLVFYIVVSTPRRALDRQRVSQARDTVQVLTAARACLGVTGSRPRTLMGLRSGDPVLESALKEAARLVLLGGRMESSVEQASGKLASYSARATMKAVATLGPAGITVDDEESRGLAESGAISRETKLPMFMTVCFFSPILLVLFAVFSHSFDPASLAELGAFEFIVLDISFYLSSGEESRER